MRVLRCGGDSNGGSKPTDKKTKPCSHSRSFVSLPLNITSSNGGGFAEKSAGRPYNVDGGIYLTFPLALTPLLFAASPPPPPVQRVVRWRSLKARAVVLFTASHRDLAAWCDTLAVKQFGASPTKD